MTKSTDKLFKTAALFIKLAKGPTLMHSQDFDKKIKEAKEEIAQLKEGLKEERKNKDKEAIEASENLIKKLQALIVTWTEKAIAEKKK